MHAKNAIVVGMVALAFALVTASASAGQQTLVLKADKAGKGAKGEAVIKDAAKDQKEITIHATGLKPGAVYTVWLVNMKPKMDMVGVGSGDYSFKSDDKGVGHYSGAIAAAELAKWQMLEVALHPDGDPKNMKKMGIALTADLK